VTGSCRVTPAEGWTWSRLRVGTSRTCYPPGVRPNHWTKLDGIVSTTLDHAVDILGLQEIGDQQAHDELLARRLGQDWHGVLSTHPEHRGIRVAVVSRLPETDTEQVVDLPAELAAEACSNHGQRRPGSPVVVIVIIVAVALLAGHS
jgi:hypothetical protein